MEKKGVEEGDIKKEKSRIFRRITARIGGKGSHDTPSQGHEGFNM